jgi:hypothetical protein
VSRWFDQVPEKESPAPTSARTTRRGRETYAGQKEGSVWRPKPKTDDGKDDKPQADINMVVLLPEEFIAPVDLDMSDEELGMAQLTLESKQAIFEKPEDEKRQHLKALFLKGFVNGKPVIRMLVDGGAAVNLMPHTMLRKIGKSDEDLTQTDMMLVDFKGNVSPAQGAICVELTIGSKTLPTAFLSLKGGDPIIYCWVGIGHMPIVAYHLQCINASSNGSGIQWRWSKERLP